MLFVLVVVIVAAAAAAVVVDDDDVDCSCLCVFVSLLSCVSRLSAIVALSQEGANTTDVCTPCSAGRWSPATGDEWVVSGGVVSRGSGGIILSQLMHWNLNHA